MCFCSKCCLILIKLSDLDFFEEVKSVFSVIYRVKNVKYYFKCFCLLKLEMVSLFGRLEKEDVIDDVYNNSLYFVVGSNGFVFVIMVLVFVYGGNLWMYGIVF